MPLHRTRFSGLSGAIWEGQLYASGRTPGRVVDFGRFGTGPLRIDYTERTSGLTEVTLHCLWWSLAIIFGVTSFFAPFALILSFMMIIASIRSAIFRASRSPIDPEFDTTRSRLMLVLLVLCQGFLRSGARLINGWSRVDWPESLRFFGRVAYHRATSGWWKLGDEKVFRSPNGVERNALLERILEAREGAKIDPSGKTDLILEDGRFWSWAVVSISGREEDIGSITRLRLLARPSWVTRMVVLPILLLILPMVVLGFGFSSELLTLAVIYVVVTVAAKLFMRAKQPEFGRLARSVGLEPV